MKTLSFLLCLMALPALADPPGLVPAPASPQGAPLTAAEFEAYALGKTLTYAQSGQVWGQEQYLPDHQVIWAFTDQPCEFGHWTEERTVDDAPLICFVYESTTEPNCWQFYRDASGLSAVFLGDGGPALAEVAQTDKPMQCPGPRVGV